VSPLSPFWFFGPRLVLRASFGVFFEARANVLVPMLARQVFWLAGVRGISPNGIFSGWWIIDNYSSLSRRLLALSSCFNARWIQQKIADLPGSLLCRICSAWPSSVGWTWTMCVCSCISTICRQLNICPSTSPGCFE
jgi:hypothetical protein